MTDTVDTRATSLGRRDVAGGVAAIFDNFLGHSPQWYKATVLGFLALNPLALLVIGPVATGWLIVAQFLFTLAMALKCYPLMPGGLLAIQAILLGLTNVNSVYEETVHQLPVILLITFMVSGVYFLKDFLFFALTKMILGVSNRIALAFAVCASISFFSAFLDALTILAVLVTVVTGFYEVYQRVVARHPDSPAKAAELEKFRAFLRGMLMHAAVGTAIGGVCTLVGEPENLVIGAVAGWNFGEFFIQVAPVSLPVLAAGLVTCLVLEHFRVFGYGAEIPRGVYNILKDFDVEQERNMTHRQKMLLVTQGFVCAVLIVALALHVAEVGLVGLAVIVLAAALNGVNEEHKLGKAFETGLPFASLLVVFFVIVAMIHDQHMFEPVIQWVLGMDGYFRLLMVYLSNGLLSAVSDNVFVAAIYIDQINEALKAGLMTREQFDDLAVAVVMGTGIPAMATPNGQAAFLFLFTSAIAGLVQLSYGRMVWMALPYVIATSVVAAGALDFLI
ncbi:MAG: sodium/proton antiporter NhaB [Rhodospirillaceae bacterium]|nr:sodium/proton antiporter NhaB [Rhodospirillaceae bacterium]